MNLDQAQPGTQAVWFRPDGTQQRVTVLEPPADQSEHALVTWETGPTLRREHLNRFIPIDRLQAIPKSEQLPDALRAERDLLRTAVDAARDVLLECRPPEELYEALAQVYGIWPPPKESP